MSERPLGASFKAELPKQQVRVAFLVFLDFPSGAVRYHTGSGDLSHGGYTWSGAGEAIAFSAFPESTNGEAVGCTVDISGCDATAMSDILDDAFQGRDAEVHLAFFDSNLSIIDTELVFKGRMDTARFRLGKDKTAIASIAIENQLIDQIRPNVRRYSSEDQAALYPATVDKGFDLIPLIQDKPLFWGNVPQ